MSSELCKKGPLGLHRTICHIAYLQPIKLSGVARNSAPAIREPGLKCLTQKLFSSPVVAYFIRKGTVLDLGSQSRDVVLVRRTFSSEKPQGVGILEWGGDGDREISLRATWDQGGRDHITARRVSK